MSSRVVQGLAAVQVVAGRRDPTAPLSVGTISRELGVTLSSASRLCSELEAAGFLGRGDAYGTYRLGRDAIRLSGGAAAPFARTVRFALTLAAQQTGETVFLTARSAGGIRVIDSVESLWTLHSPADVGDLVADERSAVMRTATAAAVESPEPWVESTIGMSVEIAAPVLTPAGAHVAVVALRLPINRVGQNLPRARRAVVTARRTIERSLAEWIDEPRSPEPDLAAPAGASALEAAFRILRHFAAGPDTVAGTARAVGLRPDRTLRLIESCRRAGFVWANRDQSRYGLGWIVHGWYRAAAAPTIVAGGKPLAAEIANRTRTCGFITVLKGMRSFTLVEELEMAGDGLQMSSWLGRAHPIIGSDGGPTLLMDFGAQEVTQLFPTRHTAHELDVFLKRVRRVDRDGVLSMQAFEDAGIVSVSAPVRDSSGTVAAAACVVGTTQYMQANAAEVEAAARELAERVSALLR
ncbi:DNA-binding IclR family transcriptional regulator [Conyzicola lurida]|uniref:DNA-binding IclR family transcriptional regulator n=1 Tax=Conyzicola lurida TaxID=1172621 RepID=A0A841AR03_9MICO|nr:DNA-binding IclR family transcriptional regulator [Conyzicola lurida]